MSHESDKPLSNAESLLQPYAWSKADPALSIPTYSIRLILPIRQPICSSSFRLSCLHSVEAPPKFPSVYLAAHVVFVYNLVLKVLYLISNGKYTKDIKVRKTVSVYSILKYIFMPKPKQLIGS